MSLINNKDRPYQVVILGASGFTGVFVVEEWKRSLAREGLTIKWAAAGRSEAKVRRVLEKVTPKRKASLEPNEILEVDVNDETSLREMTKNTNLVLNCVGPYRYYGEQVYKACVETKTHYLDICGEPEFMESMQLMYHQEAEEKQIYLISACGWDSLCFEVGVNHVRDNFDGVLNSVESYLSGGAVSYDFSCNSTTWDAIVESIYSKGRLQELRRNLFGTVFGEAANFRSKYPLERKRVFEYNEIDASGWCFPSMGSDRSVGRRTQFHNLKYFGERPAEVEAYLLIPTINVLRAGLTQLMLMALVPFTWGRNLLHKYPDFFTLGLCRKNGPSREEIEACDFRMTFVGKGWAPGDGDEPHKAPNKKVEVVIEGPHPGYPTTAACLVQSALTLLMETKLMAGKGGVLTPGNAFRKTTLSNRLTNGGLSLRVKFRRNEGLLLP